MSTAPDVTGAKVAAAQNYRSRGWHVIQLHSINPAGTCTCGRQTCGKSSGKHPINSAWQKSVSPSGPDIHAMWEDRPDANVGIATGPSSALWVLDIDPDGGGMESMRDLVAKHGPLPETFAVKTGSGGYHYYFKLEVGLRNSQGRIGKGIDVRAEGGQVVAPPSVSGIGVYTVLRDAPLAHAPEWLLELARKPERDDTETVTAADLPRPEDIDPAEWERLTAYAKRAISSELGRLDRLSQTGWDGEPWDLTTFEVACCLIEFANSPWNAYSIGQAQADLLAHAPRDNEGFDDWKVKQKFSSAMDKVGDKARPIPQSQTPRSDEPDPLFSSPDVRNRRHPTEGGGGPTTPAVGGTGRFFDEKGALLVDVLGKAIRDQGAIGWGVDNAWWSFENGVWIQDPMVVRRRASRLLRSKARKGHASETDEHLRFHPDVPLIEGAPHAQYMNFRNGMLDWQTGELLEHDPSYASTVQFPIEWKPEAQCPAFDRFLSDVMHPDYVDLAWEMIGYLMYSGNPLQVAFLLYGTGGNGKGTLTRVIQDILGDVNVANEPLDRLNTDRFSAVNLFSKIANIAGDIDATYQESTAAFKRLTGEDKIAAERKFGDRFVFESWAVPLFSANKIPGSSDVSEGYLRRWVVLHFHKRVQNPVLGLSNILATEVEGVAAKAVIALRRLMERGKFDPQGQATEGKREFAQSVDQIRQWLASGEIQTAPDHQEPLAKLYAEYSIWAGRTSRKRVNETEFSHRLEAAGRKPTTVAGLIYHEGIRIPDRQPTTNLWS